MAVAKKVDLRIVTLKKKASVLKKRVSEGKKKEVMVPSFIVSSFFPSPPSHPLTPYPFPPFFLWPSRK